MRDYRDYEVPIDIQKELELDQIRHRDIDVEGCSCKGCMRVRETEKVLLEREREEEQYRLFLKALRGIRKNSGRPR